MDDDGCVHKIILKYLLTPTAMQKHFPILRYVDIHATYNMRYSEKSPLLTNAAVVNTEWHYIVLSKCAYGIQDTSCYSHTTIKL